MKDEVYNVGSENMNLSKQDVAEYIKKLHNYEIYYADVGEDLDKRNYEVSYAKLQAVGEGCGAEPGRKFTAGVSLDYGIRSLLHMFESFEARHKYSNV